MGTGMDLGPLGDLRVVRYTWRAEPVGRAHTWDRASADATEEEACMLGFLSMGSN